MFKRVVGMAQGFRKSDIDYTLLQQDSSKLAIILPGKGYSVEAPLLFYSTSLVFNNGYDVLHINYHYDHPEFSEMSAEEQSEQIKADVDSVVNEVLANNQYTDFLLIAKSIGTIGLAHLTNMALFEKARAVWLTPLLIRDNVFQAMLESRQPGLTVIGTKDPVYHEERLASLQNNKKLIIKTIAEADHSLEIDQNPYTSIGIVKDVLKNIEGFVGK